LWKSATETGTEAIYTEDSNNGQEILGVRVSNPFVA